MSTVFFSWQSDAPNRTGRTFIENALKRAIERIASDLDVEPALREDLSLDRDTKGIPGQPPIVDTIFKKIDRAAVFVPDLTFVGQRVLREPHRPTPNPNVLIEYGWALKTLGHGRIVAVMNTAYGHPEGEAVPFDMRHLRRPICYSLSGEADKEAIRKEGERLNKVLETALRDVLQSPEHVASLPKPALPPPFPAVTPKNGPARFRAAGEALGINDSDMHLFQGGTPPDVLLRDGPCMWLRLMPTAATTTTWSVPELKRLLFRNGIDLLPLYCTRNVGGLRASDGVGTYNKDSLDDTMTGGAAFAFKTGEIWSVVADLLALTGGHGSGRPGLPFVEPYFTGALDAYDRTLKKLGLSRPFTWIAGLEGVKGYGLHWPPKPGHSFSRSGPFGWLDTDVITMQGIFEVDATPVQALKPFFTSMFEHCGFEREDYLDAIKGS